MTCIKKILLLFLSLCLIVLSACDDKYKDFPEYEFPIKITLSENNIDASASKNLSVDVILSTMEGFTKMEIYKEANRGSSLYKIVDEKAFDDNSYTFKYSVTEEDTDKFSFVFRVFVDRKSTIRTLYITNRKGLFLTNLTTISRVTGKSLDYETYPNPNNTHLHYELTATDLGIIWEIEPGRVGLFFGDSYAGDFYPGEHGGPHNVTDWRSNVLAFSENTNLDNGLIISGMATDPIHSNRAREIIPRWGYKAFTSIPTSAIEVQGVQYVHFMNWQVFGGEEELNYSSLYKSTDKGESWTSCEEEIMFPANSYFGQIGYAKRDGYVYMIGTPIGRAHSARLARFREEDILNQDKYEYWNSTSRIWIKGLESAASIILDGTVGEMSVMYLEKHKKWIVLYFDGAEYAICYRTASELNGEWSTERILASGFDYPQLYGSYMHPFAADGDQIYFTMSLWRPYNVFFMRAGIEVF